MFNRTLKRIAIIMRANLFNPNQASSPQLWHVPQENVFDIAQTPDVGKVPRVVFTLGPLESDTRNRVEAFDTQPEQKTVSEEIIPAEHSFAQTYTLQNIPLKPIIEARAFKTNGTIQILAETDDFLVNYNKGEITLREDVHDLTKLEITYRTDEIIGPASTILMTQFFSIEVTAHNPMKAEAIAAVIIGVIEAYKEYMLARADKTFDGLNVITYLKVIDIQWVNKTEEIPTGASSTVKLDFQAPGMMRIAGKVPGEKPSIIEKIFHPEVVESELDVVVKVDTSGGPPGGRF